jgi:hypothetical protein
VDGLCHEHGKKGRNSTGLGNWTNRTTMIPEVQNYYLTKEEPGKSCLFALRSIILQQDKDITETQKWGMPCFCYKKKMFCYLWTDKETDEPYILMVEGKHLVHPELEAGKRSRMKIFRVNPNKDLPLQTIENILQESLNLYRTGIVKLKK